MKLLTLLLTLLIPTLAHAQFSNGIGGAGFRATGSTAAAPATFSLTYGASATVGGATTTVDYGTLSYGASCDRVIVANLYVTNASGTTNITGVTVGGTALTQVAGAATVGAAASIASDIWVSSAVLGGTSGDVQITYNATPNPFGSNSSAAVYCLKSPTPGYVFGGGNTTTFGGSVAVASTVPSDGGAVVITAGANGTALSSLTNGAVDATASSNRTFGHSTATGTPTITGAYASSDGLTMSVASWSGCVPGTEATTFLARTSGLSGKETDAYCNLINGLVADGIWTKFDAFYVLATKNTTTAALNLVSTSYSLTTNGSPVFTADRGYAGASAAWLGTGFNPTTATTPKMGSNDASVWAWAINSFTSGVDYGSLVDVANASSNLRIYPHYSDDNFYFNINSTGFPIYSSGPQISPFFGASRTGATTSTGYQNTVAASNDPATQAIANADIVLLNASVGGGGTFFAGQCSFAAFGASLNGTQEAALYARIHTYLQVVAGVP